MIVENIPDKITIKEIIDIMMTLFDDDYILETYIKDRVKKHVKEAEKNAEKETAIRMIRMGKLSLQEIALCVPSLSLDELKEIEAELMRSA